LDRCPALTAVDQEAQVPEGIDIDVEVIVFDVLGTMVDEPGGLRTAIRKAVPGVVERDADRLLAEWQEHVEREQRRVVEGHRAFVPADVIDREAAVAVAARAGVDDSATVERLATAGRRLEPWPDAVGGLARLSARFPVLGLSNASRATLLRLNAWTGLRWHQVLSAEDARTYKPAPEIYRLAVDASGCRAAQVLMVAAHAWDLRGAQAVGMRTAYIQRPVGDPLAPDDTFDLRFDALEPLIAALTPAG
jgi:2-haloacid dehalogenase